MAGIVLVVVVVLVVGVVAVCSWTLMLTFRGFLVGIFFVVVTGSLLMLTMALTCRVLVQGLLVGVAVAVVVVVVVVVVVSVGVVVVVRSPSGV